MDLQRCSAQGQLLIKFSTSRPDLGHIPSLPFHIPTRLRVLDTGTATGDNSLLSGISSDLNCCRWQNTIFWKRKKEPAELEVFLHPFARFHGVNSNAWLPWLP